VFCLCYHLLWDIVLIVCNTGYSCGCFSANNSMRQRAMALLATNQFDYFMLGVTIVSCVTLMFEKPTGDVATTMAQMDSVTFTLWILNLITTCIFAIESIIKFVALGVFRRSHAYFRDGWFVDLSPIPSFVACCIH
jgi:magnesium-transporting ATPase (P-type)